MLWPEARNLPLDWVKGFSGIITWAYVALVQRRRKISLKLGVYLTSPQLLCMLLPAVQNPYQHPSQDSEEDLPPVRPRVRHGGPSSTLLPLFTMASRWGEQGMVCKSVKLSLCHWLMWHGTYTLQAQYLKFSIDQSTWLCQEPIGLNRILCISFLFCFQFQRPLDKPYWRSLQLCCLCPQEKESPLPASPVRVWAPT